MIDLPPAGGGIRTCDLVVERSVCNPTGLYPSLPPSGTQNTLFTQHLQNLSNTFRIYPTPSGFIQHLQKLFNPFRIYPTPSEFIQPLQDLSNTFRIYPTFSECSQPFQSFPNIFSLFPTFSEFTHHLQKSRFWGRCTCLYLF